MSSHHPWYRKATWLLPGLVFKRWIALVVFGMVFLMIGAALMLNLQPVTLTIGVLKWLARYIPYFVSGPALILAGTILLTIGFKKVYETVSSSMSLSGSDTSLLEALYRRNKLEHGPRIVAIGGGTGLSTLLRGLKHYTNNITAVVTVGDDGGSSGRLREEQGIIPPGDIRNCIAALANEEDLITELFQYRFRAGQGLEGHSFGNLFLTAMCRVTGDMMSAIQASSKVLNIQGVVLPSTLESIALVAEMEDGRIIRGESLIPEAGGRINRLRCEPENPKPLDDVIQAIQQAELIILGPGSLYTSVVPNLLIEEIAKAVSHSKALKLYVANVMTQPGETDGFSVADHIQVILDHAGQPNIMHCVLVNDHLPASLLEKYRKAGYEPVTLDRDRLQALNIDILEKNLIDRADHQTIRHHSRRLARNIIHWYKQRRPKKEVWLDEPNPSQEGGPDPGPEKAEASSLPPESNGSTPLVQSGP